MTSCGGFADTPVEYAVWGLNSAGYRWASLQRGDALHAHSVFDLDGDGFNDWVAPRRGNGDDPGLTYWNVHYGSATGFAQAIPFSIPTAYPEQSFWDLGRSECGGFDPAGFPVFFVRDLTGDGFADLVVTDLCGGALTAKTWRVYSGGPSGFASPAFNFALPASFPNRTFQLEEEASASCASGSAPGYHLTDMDDDGAPDLVVTLDCSDPDVSQAYWNVYVNSGTGFAQAPVPYALPSQGCYPAKTTVQCGSPSNRTYTLDFDGDGYRDLLTTRRGGGRGVWWLHPGSSGQFSETAFQILFPIEYGSFLTSDLAFSPTAGDYDLGYALEDLSGDGAEDLVVVEGKAGSIPPGKWPIYLGGPDGLAAAVRYYDLPAPYANQSLTSLEFLDDLQECVELPDELRYTVLDLTGDGIADFVETSRCGHPDLGADYWLVYPGSGCPNDAQEPPEDPRVCAESPALGVNQMQTSAGSDILFSFELEPTLGPVPLDPLRVRYLFTDEETAGWTSAIYSATLSNGQSAVNLISAVSVARHALTTPVAGANAYFEFTFATPEVLEPGESLSIRAQLFPVDFGPPVQSAENDYSYSPYLDASVPWDRLVVVRDDGALLAGCLPPAP